MKFFAVCTHTSVSGERRTKKGEGAYNLSRSFPFSLFSSLLFLFLSLLLIRHGSLRHHRPRRGEGRIYLQFSIFLFALSVSTPLCTESRYIGTFSVFLLNLNQTPGISRVWIYKIQSNLKYWISKRAYELYVSSWVGKKPLRSTMNLQECLRSP